MPHSCRTRWYTIILTAIPIRSIPLKHRLLELLACPGCRNVLALSASIEKDGEVVEGILSCEGCSAAYPIRNSVPRFVPLDEYADTFSFEWNTFHDVQLDILNRTDLSEKEFRGKTGWSPENFRGRLALDAGVGAGRFSEIASRWGAEVVGVDISFSVEAAQRNIGGRENVHIVQADLFRLPFRKEVFDLGFSMGVLHHTPDTKKAFEAVIPFVKPGGQFAVFLYGMGPYAYFSDIWRKVTTRIPYRLVYYLSALAVPLYPLYRLPILGIALQLLFPIGLHPDWRWRWLNTFDWYSPKFQNKHTWPEVHQWFEESGFTEMKLFMESRETSLANINFRGRKLRGSPLTSPQKDADPLG